MSTELPFHSLDALVPLDFFSITLDLPFAQEIDKRKIGQKVPPLPDVSLFLAEPSFADFYLAWNEEGLIGKVHVHKPFEESLFPDYEQGDSIEVFIDTRDRKTGGFATRFCHHFVFLAHPVQQVQAQEFSKFRSDDTHSLCDSSLLAVQVKYGSGEYTLDFSLPSSCLHGYDPQTFPRIGFSYKINRYKGASQHFSVSSQYFDIMQSPSLWASFKLVTS